MKSWLITLALGIVCSLSSYSQGCWDSIVVSPFINIPDTIGLCIDGNYTPSIELVPQNYDSILWSTGENTLSIDIDTAGQYWVTVTIDTCTWQSDTVVAGIYPVNPYILVDGPTEFCHGESVQLCVEPQPFASVHWSSGGTTPCITVTETGEYCTVILDQYGCLDTTDTCVSVIVHNPDPFVFIENYTLYCYDTTFVSYQWYESLPGSENWLLISGANDYHYSPTSGWLHYVEVTDSFGCVGISSYMSLPPGFDEHFLIKTFNLYPNPTQGEVFLDLELKTSEEVAITIFDAMGRIVQTQAIKKSLVTKTNINLDKLNKGIYILHLNVGGENITRKLVKE